MKKWKRVITFLVLCLMVIVCKEPVNAEDGEGTIVPGETIPTLPLSEEPITISGIAKFYFSPSETQGYALHMSADGLQDGILANVNVIWSHEGSDENWIEDFCQNYNIAYSKDGFEVDCAHYIKAGVKYRIVVTPSGCDIKVNMKQSDLAGIYQDLVYRVDKTESDTYCTIESYEGNATEVVIPGEINGYPVKKIDDRAFEGCTSITKVSISENVESLGNGSFSGCSNLKILELPSTLQSLGGTNEFSNEPIEQVIFPNGSKYGRFENNAFIMNNKLVKYCGGDQDEYIVPEGVLVIGSGAFRNCKLSSVRIPESVYVIGNGSFENMDLKDCYIANASCQIGTYQDGTDYSPFKSTEESGARVYDVTVHAPSGGVLEKICKDNNITFESTGEMNQYTDMKVGQVSILGQYSDGKLYGSLAVDEDGVYSMMVGEKLDYMLCDVPNIYGGSWCGMSSLTDISIVDENGAEVSMYVPGTYNAYIYLEKDHKYSVIWDKTYNYDYKTLNCIYFGKYDYALNTVHITQTYINDMENSQIQVDAGTSVSLRVDAKTDVKNRELTYHWYRFENGEKIELEGTDKTFTIDAVDKSSCYICTVSDGFSSEDTSILNVTVNEDSKTLSEISMELLGKFEVGKSAVFAIRIKNCSMESIGGFVTVDYCGDDKESKEFGQLKDNDGQIVNRDTYISLQPGEIKSFTWTGVVPDDWNETSQMIVGFDMEDDGKQQIFYSVSVADRHVHSYGDWQTTKEPTYTEKGLRTKTCTGCGDVVTEEIPMLNKPAETPTNPDSQKPVETPTNPVSQQPTTQQPVASAETAQIGETVKQGTDSYLITSTEDGNMTVTYKESGNESTKVVTVPDKVVIAGKEYIVTDIATDAFKNNKKVTNIKIGKNITKIGKNAFKNCKNLKKITITSTKLTKKSIGKNAFKGTNGKLVVKVPKNKKKEYAKFLKAKGNKKIIIK
mgnify:CR=1 FL=1